MKQQNHTQRMVDKYIDMAAKANTEQVRDECIKRAKMLLEMDKKQLKGETDAQFHRRSVKYMQAKERGDDMTLAIEKINREFGR